MKEERKKVWIHGFQTRLFLRIGIYWLIYQVAVWNFLFVWRLLAEGAGNPLEQFGRFFREYYPSLICFVVVVPILAWDAVRFTHRLLGPLVRFKRSIQAVADGEPTRPIKLREGDFLLDVKDEFNRMLDSLQRQGIPVLKPADPTPTSETRQQSA